MASWRNNSFLPSLVDEISVQDRCSGNDFNQGGYTAVHLAASEGNVDDLKKIYGSGTIFPDVLAKITKMTPLQLASMEGNMNAVEFLIENGHNVKGKGAIGETPLYLAVQNRHVEVVKRLLRYSKDIADMPNSKGITPFLEASRNNDIEIMTLLLNTDAVNVNHKASKGGGPPLCTACYYGHVEAVKFLLKQKGVQLDDVEAEGKTALQLAQEKGHDGIVQLLKAAGA